VTPALRQVLVWSFRVTLIAITIAGVRWQLLYLELPSDFDYSGRNGRFTPLFFVVMATLGLAVSLATQFLKPRPTRGQWIMDEAAREQESARLRPPRWSWWTALIGVAAALASVSAVVGAVLPWS
jgi:hypothetical protein